MHFWLLCNDLTAVFFETGAMLTPTKSRNGTNCGSGGSFQSYLTHSYINTPMSRVACPNVKNHENQANQVWAFSPSGYPLLGVLGAWMTFKKAEMAKTLRNGLSMIETNPLNYKWFDFAIYSGLALHQFQKNCS